MLITSGTIVFDSNKDEYKVLEFIGNGNFGNVFRIERCTNNDIFALKTLLTPFADQETLRSFKNEGNLAVKVSHKNIIKYNYFHDGSTYNQLPPYIIMEYAGDGNLENILSKKQNQKEFFTNEELKSLFAQLINGMEAINHHLVHRDIKPDNILLADNVVKITDFGLSKIIEASTRKSTLKGFGCIQYWPPEAWRYEKNTIQMDIYSMGFVFYQLATLRHPLDVEKDDIEKWREAHLFQPVKQIAKINPNISPGFDQMIMKMIEKNIKDRFHTWGEIRKLLEVEELPKSNNSKFVDAVLKKRLDQDYKAQEKRIQSEKRQKEISEFKQVIKYQFVKEIVTPIQEFINEFNTKYQGGKVDLYIPDFDIRCSLSMPSNETLDFKIEPIIEEYFYREIVRDDFGRKIRLIELQIPEYENRRIMAWGYLRASDRRGLNLILVQDDDPIYGTWFMLINRHNALSSKRDRAEPFPFDFTELEKEIRLIKSMHIYKTEHRVLDIEVLKQFIGEYV